MDKLPKERLEDLLAQLDMDYRDLLRRKRLYERGFRDEPNLPKLAMNWLQELGNEVGPLLDEVWFFNKRRPDESARKGLPDFVYHEDTLETPPLDEVSRLQIDDSQTFLLWTSEERSPEGYKTVTVRDEFFPRDMAILALVAIMESPRFEKRKQVWQYKGDEPELEFPRALLRYFRTSFEKLPADEQADMAAETYLRILNFVEALRKLIAYLEYGKAKAGLTRHPLEDVARDVRAAELKLIEGLKNHEIAIRLRMDRPKNFRDEEELKESTPVRAERPPIAENTS